MGFPSVRYDFAGFRPLQSHTALFLCVFVFFRNKYAFQRPLSYPILRKSCQQIAIMHIFCNVAWFCVLFCRFSLNFGESFWKVWRFWFLAGKNSLFSFRQVAQLQLPVIGNSDDAVNLLPKSKAKNARYFQNRTVFTVYLLFIIC